MYEINQKIIEFFTFIDISSLFYIIFHNLIPIKQK